MAAPQSTVHYERVTNMHLVQKIMTHPRVWDKIADDGTGPRDVFVPANHPAIWHIGAFSWEPLGLFSLYPENSICWNLHVCVLPLAWRRTEELTTGLFRWVWRNTSCLRITAHIPCCNRLALLTAFRIMEQFGLDKGSYLKDGILVDRLFFAVNRPEVN